MYPEEWTKEKFDAICVIRSIILEKSRIENGQNHQEIRESNREEDR